MAYDAWFAGQNKSSQLGLFPHHFCAAVGVSPGGDENASAKLECWKSDWAQDESLGEVLFKDRAAGLTVTVNVGL